MTALAVLLFAAALVLAALPAYLLGYRHGLKDARNRVEAWGRARQREETR